MWVHGAASGTHLEVPVNRHDLRHFAQRLSPGAQELRQPELGVEERDGRDGEAVLHACH